MATIHLCGGPAPRGTEEAVTRLLNSDTELMRNVIFIQGTIGVQNGYALCVCVCVCVFVCVCVCVCVGIVGDVSIAVCQSQCAILYRHLGYGITRAACN